MADRDSVYEWLAAAKFRYLYEKDSRMLIVRRLIAEGRAKWSSPTSCRLVAIRPDAPRQGEGK